VIIPKRMLINEWEGGIPERSVSISEGSIDPRHQLISPTNLPPDRASKTVLERNNSNEGTEAEYNKEDSFIVDTLEKISYYCTRYPCYTNCDSVILRARAQAIDEDLVLLDKRYLTRVDCNYGKKFDNRWANFVLNQQESWSGQRRDLLIGVMNEVIKRNVIRHYSYREHGLNLIL